MHLLNRIFSRLPASCQLCHHPLSGSEHVWCQPCRDSIPRQPRCDWCGLPTPYPMEVCGRCLREPPGWDSLTCISDYRFPLNTMVHQLKYHGRHWYAGLAAAELAAGIDNPAPVLLPVPMHWKRRFTRRFNHSTLLAKALAAETGGRVETGWLKRTGYRPQQQKLDRKTRLKSPEGSFEITAEVNSGHVGIVDDVVTTGTTVATIARLLKKQHNIQVDIYCICRTP